MEYNHEYKIDSGIKSNIKVSTMQGHLFRRMINTELLLHCHRSLPSSSFVAAWTSYESVWLSSLSSIPDVPHLVLKLQKSLLPACFHPQFQNFSKHWFSLLNTDCDLSHASAIVILLCSIKPSFITPSWNHDRQLIVSFLYKLTTSTLPHPFLLSLYQRLSTLVTCFRPFSNPSPLLSQNLLLNGDRILDLFRTFARDSESSTAFI
ncbi:hypothetical protein P9112_004218 [Eukaryota sp. TZLM1-RC]